jgi:hypothetical protein
MADSIEDIELSLLPDATESIFCNRSEWKPSSGLGSHEATSLIWGYIENDGIIPTDVTIRATNSTAWTLNLTVGHNKFNFSSNIGNGWLPITYLDTAFILDLDAGQNKSFGLRTYLPTSSSTNQNQTVTITFTATPQGSASDCNTAESEMRSMNTANTMYYAVNNEYAPDVASMEDYGFVPEELTTGFMQYNRTADGKEAGYWEATARMVPCLCTEDVGRWTCTASTGIYVWRNETEFQAWRTALGI